MSIDDLEETDLLYAQCLRGIRDIHLNDVNQQNFHEVKPSYRVKLLSFYLNIFVKSQYSLDLQIIPLECFEGTSCTGRMMPIMPGGRSVPLTFQNRMHYVEQAVNFRLHEMDLQVSPVLAPLSALCTLLMFVLT